MKQDCSPLHLKAAQHPDSIAIYCWREGIYQAISYQELSQQVLSCTKQLAQLGLSKGDKLACVDQNSLAMVLLYWACVDLGAIFCPLNPKFPEAQIATLANRYQLRHFWADKAYQALLPQASLSLTFEHHLQSKPQAIDPSTPCNIILTSGSSGMPKAAVHCLNNHIASAQGSTQLIPLTQGDNWLLSLPMFHIGGLAIVNRCVLAGAAITLPAAELSLAEQLKARPLTHLSLVATQLLRLLNDAPTTLKGLKALLLGGGVIDEQLIAQLEPLGVPAYTSYGMTEMSSQITTTRANPQGSCGMPLPGRQLKIVDEVIYVRGETLFLGYLDAESPERIAKPLQQDGWFCTQDRGRWNTAGELLILGRTDNMFICGGENIQPEEIEAVLRRYPGIEEALVFALPDEEFGLLPAALIKGHCPPTAQLDAFLCQHIARFKRPRRYYPWPKVEQTGLKLQRKQLIQAAAQRYGLDIKKPA